MNVQMVMANVKTVNVSTLLVRIPANVMKDLEKIQDIGVEVC